MKKVVRILIVCSLWSAALAAEKWGFDTPYGFIPNGCPDCRVEVDLSEPLHDGQIISLDFADTIACGWIDEWRVTEYRPDEFFAAMVIPLPDPLELIYGDKDPTDYGRLRDELECESVELTEAPIQDAHEVLKTEECIRVLTDAFPAEDVFRGHVVGNTTYENLNRRVVSEFKRWLVKVDDPESATGLDYTLMVVESFAPEHGNARWHEVQWGRFYEGPPDVSEGDCPPGDWRDIVPRNLDSFRIITYERAYGEAARLDYSGRPPSLENGMSVHPTGGGKTRPSDSGKYERTDTAEGYQIHQVIEERPGRCIATARLMIPEKLNHTSSFSSGSKPNPNIGAFRRRMSEDDQISIGYSRVWARSHIWYRMGEKILVPDNSFVDGSRIEDFLPDIPNYAVFHRAFISYRESDQSDEPVVVPSKCTASDASALGRQPSRTRSR